MRIAAVSVMFSTWSTVPLFGAFRGCGGTMGLRLLRVPGMQNGIPSLNLEEQNPGHLHSEFLLGHATCKQTYPDSILAGSTKKLGAAWDEAPAKAAERTILRTLERKRWCQI